MIDTIGVMFPSIFIPPNVYSLWDNGGKNKKKGNGFVIYWYGFTFELPNGATFQITYFPYVKNGLLKIEFSLPHVVFGSNVYMVYNIENAFDEANLLLATIPGIPSLDLRQGIIYRLDVPHNHLVGDLVPYYIKAMKNLDCPRRDTFPYPSGVVFGNKHSAIKFYDKEKERLKDKDFQGAINARGILRQEVSLNKKQLERWTKKKNPTLRDIDVNLLLDILEYSLNELGLSGNSIGTVNTALERLCSEYGEEVGLVLFALLMAKNQMPSEEEICSIIERSKRTLKRRLKKILEAGVPLTITDYEEPLPPLYIDRELVIEQSGR